jgi:hypothetical protein
LPWISGADRRYHPRWPANMPTLESASAGENFHMSTKNRLAALLLATVVLLSGCVTLPPQQAFNRDVAQIRTIHVMPLDETEVRLSFLNHPGMNFGLIGGLIAASDITSKENKLQELIAASSLDHIAVFREELTQAMQARGYELRWSDPVVQTGKVARDSWGLRKAYAAIEGADAQMDLGLIFAGYATSGAGDASPYRPAVHVAARLLDPSGKQNLFTDVITYNNITNIATAITVNPDERYAYPDFEQLDAAGPKVAEGLQVAIEATAIRLSEQF